MESAPAEHSAANSRAKPQRTPKSGLAKRYQVGIRTIENWQYSGVIYARFEQGRAVFDVADCDSSATTKGSHTITSIRTLDDPLQS